MHDALVETIGIPPDDRFQVLVSHDGTGGTLRYDDFLAVHRDDGIVYVAITMRSGRTPAQKQALYRRGGRTISCRLAHPSVLWAASPHQWSAVVVDRPNLEPAQSDIWRIR